MSGLEALKYLTIKPNSIWAERDGPDWEDIAGTLAKASDIAACYGRYKYCLETKWHNKLINYLYSEAKKLNWNKTVSDKDIFIAVNLALYEMVNPSICPKCNGRREVIILDKLYKCDVCDGSGKKQMSDRARGLYLKGERSVFYRYFKYNYFNHIIPILDQWEMELNKVFNPYNKVK